MGFLVSIQGRALGLLLYQDLTKNLPGLLLSERNLIAGKTATGRVKMLMGTGAPCKREEPCNLCLERRGVNLKNYLQRYFTGRCKSPDSFPQCLKSIMNSYRQNVSYAGHLSFSEFQSPVLTRIWAEKKDFLCGNLSPDHSGLWEKVQWENICLLCCFLL